MELIGDEGDVTSQLSQCLNDLEELNKKEIKAKIKKDMEKKALKPHPDLSIQEESVDLLAPEDQEELNETQLDGTEGPSWILHDKSLNQTGQDESICLDNTLIRSQGPQVKKYTLNDLHQASGDVMGKRKGMDEDRLGNG